MVWPSPPGLHILLVSKLVKAWFLTFPRYHENEKGFTLRKVMLWKLSEFESDVI